MATFDTYSLTRSGGRTTNMDYSAHAVRNGIGCWAVADGLGGHRRSEIAAQVAVETVMGAFERQAGTLAIDPVVVRELVDQAQAAVLARKAEDPELTRIATTLVVLLSDGVTAIWAHVGDSRLYHLQRGTVVFQTRDHSVSQSKAESGEIQHDQIRGDRDRSSLFQALGNPGRLRPTVPAAAVAIGPDDAFLLCVDGFWEHVHEAEMAIDLAKSSTTEQWLGLLEARIRGRLTGDDDNYTALAIRMNDVAGPARPLTPPVTPTPPAQTQPPDQPFSRKLTLAGAAVGVCLFAIVALVATFTRPSPTDPCIDEITAWGEIDRSRSLEQYEHALGEYERTFLEQHCVHADDVQKRIDERDRWSKVDKDDVDAVESFLRGDPSRFYKEEAQIHRKRHEGLAAKAAAEKQRCLDASAAWAKVVASKTLQPYETALNGYMRAFPSDASAPSKPCAHQEDVDKAVKDSTAWNTQVKKATTATDVQTFIDSRPHAVYLAAAKAYLEQMQKKTETPVATDPPAAVTPASDPPATVTPAADPPAQPPAPVSKDPDKSADCAGAGQKWDALKKADPEAVARFLRELPGCMDGVAEAQLLVLRTNDRAGLENLSVNARTQTVREEAKARHALLVAQEARTRTKPPRKECDQKLTSGQSAIKKKSYVEAATALEGATACYAAPSSQ
jgi:PPM family protein phosphatase